MYRISFIINGGTMRSGGELIIEDDKLLFTFLGKQIIEIPFNDVYAVSFDRVWMQFGKWLTIKHSAGTVQINGTKKAKDEIYGTLNAIIAKRIEEKTILISSAFP